MTFLTVWNTVDYDYFPILQPLFYGKVMVSHGEKNIEQPWQITQIHTILTIWSYKDVQYTYYAFVKVITHDCYPFSMIGNKAVKDLFVDLQYEQSCNISLILLMVEDLKAIAKQIGKKNVHT